MSASTIESALATAIPVQAGLARLADEVRLVRRPVRPAAPTDGVCALLEAELRLAVEAGDAERAHGAAVALAGRDVRLHLLHAAISRALAQAAAAVVDGRCDIVTANRMAAAAAEVLHRLRAAGPRSSVRPTRGRVVLAVPPGDAHVLALQSLACLLESAGWTADVVGELPAPELARAGRGASAVLISVHSSGGAVNGLVQAVRRADPAVLVVVGGPGAPRSDGHLVTSDPQELLQALDLRDCPLSSRECDVLRCVADGLTNAEAAACLGVSPATLKTHLDRIFDKTGAPGRAAAVAVGLRRGWIR